MTSRPTTRVRLEDVAADVGLSRASVSMVLRGVPGPSTETAERVLAAARRLGYRRDRAASLLASRRSRMIGVVLEVRSSFHAELAESLLAAADRQGYDLLLGARTAQRDEARAVESLIDSRCEALVLLGTEEPVERLDALARQVAVVAVGTRLPGTACDVVRVDDTAGTARLVDHLVADGHRAIAYVDGGAEAIAADRRAGYRAAMSSAGLDAHVRVLAGGKDEIEGARSARDLLAGGPLPTAVVVFNDQAAVGVAAELERAGIALPGRVSVAGYDDSPLARLGHVDLTTVSQDVPTLTRHTLAALTERLEGGRDAPREVVVEPRVVVRGSTGPAPGTDVSAPAAPTRRS